MVELTEQLERYRLEKIKEQQTAEPEKRILTAEERDEAIENLKTENLLQQTETDRSFNRKYLFCPLPQ